MTIKKHSKFWMALADHHSTEQMWTLLVLVLYRRASSNIAWVDSWSIHINSSSQWRKKLKFPLEDHHLLRCLTRIWIRIVACWAITPNFINMQVKKMAEQLMEFRRTLSLLFLVRTFKSSNYLKHLDSTRYSNTTLRLPHATRIISRYCPQSTTISTTKIWISSIK